VTCNYGQYIRKYYLPLSVFKLLPCFVLSIFPHIFCYHLYINNLKHRPCSPEHGEAELTLKFILLAMHKHHHQHFKHTSAWWMKGNFQCQWSLCRFVMKPVKCTCCILYQLCTAYDPKHVLYYRDMKNAVGALLLGTS